MELSRARSTVTFSIALGLHGLLLLALGMLPLRMRASDLRWSPNSPSVELDEPPSLTRPPSPRADETRAAPDPPARAQVARRSVAPPRSGGSTVAAAIESTGPAPAPDPGADDRWSDPGSIAEPGLRTPAALPWSERLDLARRPAPTAPPRQRPPPEAIAELALTSAVRDRDRDLGLGNPEEGIVARAVQVAGRAAAVPKNTRFRLEIDLDQSGRVTGARIASASAGDEQTWRGVIEAVRGSLGDAVQIGPDVRRAGGRVVVDAEVKHVLVSGADEEVTIGACPTDPHTSGIWPAESFFGIGGTPYGDYATGTCPLSDATNGQPRQIQVRTRARIVLPGTPPAPVTSYPKPWKRTRLPTIWEIIFG